MLRSERLLLLAAALALTAGTAFAAEKPKTAAALASAPADHGSVQPAAANGYLNFKLQASEAAKLRLDKKKSVDQAKALLVPIDDVAIAQGFVAEFAKVAAANPAFRDSARKLAKKSGGPEKFAARLKGDPRIVLKAKKWQEAARDVALAVQRDKAHYDALSFRLNEIAYGRKQNEAKLAEQGGITSAVEPYIGKEPAPLMTQILALGAAMAAMDAADADSSPALKALTSNAEHDQCLRWSRLNTSQCMAAAGTNEERAYCLSTITLNSRTACWAGVTGTPG